MRRALIYSGAIFALLLISSGVVPLILGPEYRATAASLRWLAILPVLKSLHYFYSDTLTSAGYQGVRTAVQAAVAVFNVLLNLWLIPAYSWLGAAWSSIASDAILLLGVSAAVCAISRSSRLASIAEPAVREYKCPVSSGAISRNLEPNQPSTESVDVL